VASLARSTTDPLAVLAVDWLDRPGWLRFPVGSDIPDPDSGLGKDVLVPRPSKYPEQFRRDAVELVRSSGRSLREVGKELGVNHETLRNWVNVARQAEAGQHGGAESISADEREELRRLRKKVAELELEKEILRKAAQYFAKEMGR
jgi:transposase